MYVQNVRKKLYLYLQEISRMVYCGWGRRGMHVGYWWESQKERDQWEDQDIGGWTLLKWILKR
jgi:hypothetical protein